MKPSLNRPDSNVIQFTSIREPESIYIQSYQQLLTMGVRDDIAAQLACHAAFQGEKFNPKSQMLVDLHEEIGQEPLVKGMMAA